MLSVFILAIERLEISDDIEAMALTFEQSGIRARDASHFRAGNGDYTKDRVDLSKNIRSKA